MLETSDNKQEHAVPTSEQEPRFDTFVFDLDGTLLDTLPDLVELTNTALRESGFPERTAAEIRSFVGNGARALMRQAVPQDVGEQATDAAMERWMHLFPTVGNNLAEIYPGIEETLHELKARGMKLGVLSNKFEEGVKEVIRTHLPNTFSAAHGECDEIPRKPNPAGLLRTISELGSSPARTVYIGDSTGDIAVSRNAGVFSAAVTWGYHDVDRLIEAQPDLLIDHPSKLLELAG